MRKMIATWLGICMMFICSITVTAKTLTSDNMPENLPQKYHSMQYSVLADGQEVGVYNVEIMPGVRKYQTVSLYLIKVLN